MSLVYCDSSSVPAIDQSWSLYSELEGRAETVACELSRFTCRLMRLAGAPALQGIMRSLHPEHIQTSAQVGIMLSSGLNPAEPGLPLPAPGRDTGKGATQSQTRLQLTATDCQRQPNLIRAELDHYLMGSEPN